MPAAQVKEVGSMSNMALQYHSLSNSMNNSTH